MRKHNGFGECANLPLKQGTKTHTCIWSTAPYNQSTKKFSKLGTCFNTEILAGFALLQGGKEKDLFQNALLTKAMDECETNGQMDGLPGNPTDLTNEARNLKIPLWIRPSSYSSFCIYSAKHLLIVSNTRALTTCMVAEISRHLKEYNFQNE